MTTTEYNELVKKIQGINSEMRPIADEMNIEIFHRIINIRGDYIRDFNEFLDQEKLDLYMLMNTIAEKHLDEMKYVELAHIERLRLK